MSRFASSGASNEATLTITANGAAIARPKRPTMNFNRNTIDNNTLIVGRRHPSQLQPAPVSRENSVVSSPQPVLDLDNENNLSVNEPVQLTVKFHEHKVSRHDVLVDLSMVPGAKEGDVAELEPLESSSKKLYFIVKPLVDEDLPQQPSQPLNNSPQQLPTISILSSSNLQLILDLQSRSPVLVRLKSKKDVEADVVELNCKDVYLSRGDMWIFQWMLTGKCVYKTQKLTLMDNSIRFSVNGIYRLGKKVFSAYIGENTKIVFRSESAKLTFLIQLSKEMWDFEESGEIIFHKLINSLFPKIFKKWQELGRHHLITIVLFTSVDLTTRRWNFLDKGEMLPDTKHYYRVVVDQVNILQWSKIMSTLRVEFANFMKDIRLTPKGLVEGTFVPAIKGNMLELINLATTLVTDHFKDPDFRHTTNHFILITPSTGLFDVDYKLMKQTSRKMLAVDAALDIICLSQPPLHVVPLFRYKDFNFKTQHCIPSWIDVSFWSDSNQTINQWIPRCKIYEIQMMGVMENEMSDVSIQHLAAPKGLQGLLELMRDYDEGVFKPSVIANSDTTREKPVGTNSARSDTQNDATPPQTLSKRKSWDLLDLAKPRGPPRGLPVAGTTSNRMVSGATTSQDIVFGVTNSRSNITLFTSLLNLQKKPSSPSLVPKEIPNLLKRASKPSLNGPDTASVRSDNDTLATLRSFSLGHSKKTAPIRMASASGPQTPLPDSPLASSPSQHTSNDHKSGSSSYEGSARYMSTSPSRLLAGMSSETVKSLQELKQQDLKRHWNIMWTQIDNPSQTVDPHSVVSLTNGRWEHVFPKNVKRRTIKWTSLTSPALLPVTTTHFPADFQTNFTFKLYDIILNTRVHDNTNSGDLMRDMVYMRLSLGFQIIVGDKVNKIESKRKPGGDANLLVKFVKPQKYEGSRIYMSFDDEIHRICIDYNNNINVQIYKRSQLASFESEFDDNIEYFPKIRTRYDDEYCTTPINALANDPKKYNWNHLDQTLAGYDDSISDEAPIRHRVKFVILPGEITESSMSFASLDSKEQLSPEEIRLEGLRRLIATFYKGRYMSPEEIRRKGKGSKEELTPEINFYTGNLFKFLREQSGSLEYYSKDSLFVDVDSLHLSYDIKLTQLLALLQDPRTGINFVDRRWHWKTHQNCFLGLELVNWMVKHFDEVMSKDDAVLFGNKLMEENFFTHVDNRHSFLDGHYFYKLNKEYVMNRQLASPPQLAQAGNTALESDSGSNWFSKRESKSPVVGPEADSKLANKLLMTPVLQAQLLEYDSIHSGSRKGSEGTPGTLPTLGTPSKEVKRVILSRSVTYDVDPAKKSFKPELITVHYDKVHNLDHCFHIRIEWLNTTLKLIDDTVGSWARLCERFGLRLVEVPWNELFTIPTVNPFHSFVDIRLLLDPWTDPEFCEGNGLIILHEHRFFYHMFLLEKSGFLLDNRAATVLGSSEDIEVSYSWGRPTFKYAQYIHNTGAYIAEIKDTGELFLAPNNTHIAKVNIVHTQKLAHNRPNKILNSQRVMIEFRQTCKDPERLRSIFREVKSRWEVRRDIDEALSNEVEN